MSFSEPTVKPVLITHELSNIGKLDISLHGIAAIFYNQLCADGLIDYLKDLNHLGFISKSHPGNNHKRWDYVCLQLFLVQKLKHSTFKTGLNRDTDLDGKKASNQEILQTFILFANIGHLEGTLASEKGLYDFLNQNTKEKENFLSEINNLPELKDLVDKVFVKYDFYKMKYLIALNYVLRNKTEKRVIEGIKLILKKYLSEYDSQFEKLRTLFLKIRKVSFVYLDSFHCQTPIQINLSKILVNIFSYDTLFNPVDTDYDSVLEACETILSKELYLSPKSILQYCQSTTDFRDFLIKNSVHKNRIDHTNSLKSLLSHKNKPLYQYSVSTSNHVFLFYVAKESLKIIETPVNVDFDGAYVTLINRQKELTLLANRGIRRKRIIFSTQQDMKKTLIFFTFIIPKDLPTSEQSTVLGNINKTFHAVKKIFDFDLGSEDFLKDIRSLLLQNFQKDIIRRYFLYILKYLFEKESRLNLFIPFQYRQKINALNKGTINKIYETSFVQSRLLLHKDLDEYLKFPLPEDIDNNIRLLKYIADNEVTLKRNISYFYSIFPIELEEMEYSASDLDKQGNSEKRKTITDIDAILVAFQESKFEIYLVEGKKHQKRFKALCTQDLNRIKSLAVNSAIFSNQKIIEHGKYKGGYLRISN
jgi:hypothetical protein